MAPAKITQPGLTLNKGPLKKVGPVQPIPEIKESIKAIRQKHKSVSKYTGPAVGNMRDSIDGGGVQAYADGAIYWKQSTGAIYVHGAIYKKYVALGEERSFLGYPVVDEMTAPDGSGRFSDFEHGSIYWHPSTGAWEIHGAIRAFWDQVGGVKSYLGYPIADEEDWEKNIQARCSRFQKGILTWQPQAGISELPVSNRVSQNLITGDAVTGWHELTYDSKGQWVFRGHWHNSGAVGLTAKMAVYFNYVTPNNEVIAFATDADIAGHFDVGSNDHNWNTNGQDDRIAQYYSELDAGGISQHFDGTVDAEALVQDILAGLLVAGVVVIVAAIAAKNVDVCPAVVDPSGGRPADPFTGRPAQPDVYFPIVPHGQRCPK